MIRLKSNISYDPMIESVNRKFTQRANKCSKPTTEGPVALGGVRYMGGATRNGFRGGLGSCSRNYMFFRDGYRDSVVTAEEMDRRVRFAKAAAGRNYIIKDLSQVTTVTNLWIQAKDDTTKTINGVSTRGYTYRGWIMAVQYKGLEGDHSYNEKQFPTTFDA